MTIQSNPANPTVGSDGKIYHFDRSIFNYKTLMKLNFFLADRVEYEYEQNS
jgi:hypothetical protein